MMNSRFIKYGLFVAVWLILSAHTSTPTPTAPIPIFTSTPTPSVTPYPTWTPTALAPPTVTPQPVDLGMMEAIITGRFDVTLLGACRPLTHHRIIPSGLMMSVVGSGIHRLSDGERMVAVDDDNTIRFSPDGQFAYVGEGVAHGGIYRLSDGVRLLGSKNTMSFSSDSQYVHITNSDGSRSVYRLRDGLHLLRGDRHQWFSPDGQFVLQDAWDDGGVLYRLSPFEPILEGITSVRFSPNMAYAVIQRRTDVGLYDFPDMTRLFDVRGAIFSPDSRFLFNDIDFYRLSDGERVLSDGERVLSDIRLARFSSDGQYMVAPISYNNQQAVYQLSDTPQLLFEVERFKGYTDNNLYLHAQSPTGIRFYRLSDGELVLDSGGLLGQFSPDSNYVTIIEADDRHTLYRLADGEQIAQGLKFGFSPDSRYAYVQNINGLGEIYQLADGALLWRLSYQYITFSPDGDYVMMGDGIYRVADGVKVSNWVMDVGFIAGNDRQALNACGILNVNPDASPVTLVVMERANLRAKPEYTVLMQVDAGVELVAIGRSADGLWYQVLNLPYEHSRPLEFWISASVVTVSGDRDSLPVMDN
jgi:hypothetical protein